MNILILGAGQVGGTLAEHLASEAFDITLVDIDGARLRDLRDRLDIRTVHGYASRPDVLRDAGAGDADMLIAVTPNDEVNMVACQVCYSMFRTPTKIARIRADSYHSRTGFFTQEHMPIDVLINPEHVVTEQIRELLEHPGALQVLDFADGRVKLVAVKATHDSPLVGQDLRFLRKRMPKVDSRVAAIFRRGRAILPLFDAILLDAPCSGTGTLRRHPDIKVSRTPADVERAADLQRAMLASLWGVLSSGGTLLYCTCSVLPEENDAVLEDFLAVTPDAASAPIHASWGRSTDHGRIVLPSPGGPDGFYFARLAKGPAA
ncbi:MAG: hypothetical protein F4X36_20770 [Gammaproteobacteria bacterium]|nr:hypothetical protein [Gammaproteobacteria bacterium]